MMIMILFLGTIFNIYNEINKERNIFLNKTEGGSYYINVKCFVFNLFL
jgi:hypothetical protein